MSHGARAMYGVEDRLEELNGVLRSFMAAEGGGPASMVPLTPQRKQLAVQRAQKLEAYLPVPKLIGLINLFEKDVAAADTYLVIEGEPLRRAWVDNKLKTV